MLNEHGFVKNESILACHHMSVITKFFSGIDSLAFASKSRHIAVIAQLVEHFHGKEKVTGSNPVNGSTL